jgi:hypothetical protein
MTGRLLWTIQLDGEAKRLLLAHQMSQRLYPGKQLSCPSCTVLAVLSSLFCPRCPLLGVPSQLSCPRSPVPTVLSWLYCPRYPTASVYWPGFPVTAVLSRLYWLDVHVPNPMFRLPCPGCLTWLFCPCRHLVPLIFVLFYVVSIDTSDFIFFFQAKLFLHLFL